MKTFKKEGEVAQTFLVRYRILNHLINLSTLFILPGKQVSDSKKEKRRTRGKILSDRCSLHMRMHYPVYLLVAEVNGEL